MLDEKELIIKACQARKNAYAPYSDFRVGAALLCKNGDVYTGCNIESASFSATICAERTAIYKAVSDGITDFAAIAVVGGKDELPNDECLPCGVCRQVMAEFCDASFKIITGNTESYTVYSLGELLPFAFKLNDSEVQAQ